MGVDRVTVIPTYPECGQVWWPDSDERWIARHTDAEPPKLAFFCPVCAERELE